MKRLTVLGLAAFLVIGCNAGKNQTNIELVTGMMDQPSIKAQDWDPRRGGKGGMLMPPENTVPRGFKPYPYKGNVSKAEKSLRNPIAGDFTPDILSQGKAHYEVFCSVCHGPKGAGQGTVSEKMVLRPPSLLTDKVRRQYNDGRLYHVITDGQGVMGSYMSQIRDEKTRWTIVNYVRHLQKSAR